MICPHCVAEDRSPMNIQSHCNTPSCLFQSRPNNMSLYPAGAFSCCIYELAALYIFILGVLNNCRRAATLSPKLLESHLPLTAAGPSRPARERSGFPSISSPSNETSETWFVHTSTSTEGLNGVPLFRTALQWRRQTWSGEPPRWQCGHQTFCSSPLGWRGTPKWRESDIHKHGRANAGSRSNTPWPVAERAVGERGCRVTVTAQPSTLQASFNTNRASPGSGRQAAR